MDIKAPIILRDELFEDIIEAKAKLNLSSGEITDIEYVDYDAREEGFPASREDYEFTNGVLIFEGKEVEFVVETDDEEYSVNTNELQEIKSKAAALAAKIKKPGKK